MFQSYFFGVFVLLYAVERRRTSQQSCCVYGNDTIVNALTSADEFPRIRQRWHDRTKRPIHIQNGGRNRRISCVESILYLRISHTLIPAGFIILPRLIPPSMKNIFVRKFGIPNQNSEHTNELAIRVLRIVQVGGNQCTVTTSFHPTSLTLSLEREKTMNNSHAFEKEEATSLLRLTKNDLL